MGPKLLERIREAKTRDVKLFLCGVTHVFAGNIRAPLSDIINEVDPSTIIIEGRTPQSTYQGGCGTHDFQIELDDPGSHWQSPNLLSIRRIVDDLGILVAGFDMSDGEKEELERSTGLQSIRRLIEISDSFKVRIEDALDDGRRCSTGEYHSLEAIEASLYAMRNDINISDDINDIFELYSRLALITSEFPEISRFMRKELAALKGFGTRVSKYLGTRERFMAKAILSRHLEGDNTSLVLVGGGHVETNFAEKTPLVKTLERKAECFGFLNYNPFDL